MSAVIFKPSANQLEKLKSAIRNGRDATIQVESKDIVLNNSAPNLDAELTKKACQCKKSGKGMRLSISDVKGGILPFLIPALAPLLAGALTGGAAVTKTIMDNKRKYRELDELRRHNEAMEKKGTGCPTCGGSGIYLTSRRGDGIKKKVTRR